MAAAYTDEQLDQELDYSDIEAKFAPKLSFPLASALLVDGAREFWLWDGVKKILQYAFSQLTFPFFAQPPLVRTRRAVWRASSRSSLRLAALPLLKWRCLWTKPQDKRLASFS